MSVCVFLWQPNELLIFPLLGVSTIPLEFQSAVLSLCTGGLSPAPQHTFLLLYSCCCCCFPLYFPSPRHLYHAVVLIFIFRGHCRLFHLQSFSPSLAPHSVLPVLRCLFFCHGFLFLPRHSPPLTHYTPYNRPVCLCIFSLLPPLFFLNLLSDLLISLSSSSCLLALLSNHFAARFSFFPLLLPPSLLRLLPSNMLYSLSCFPECEECCCFRMSPA